MIICPLLPRSYSMRKRKYNKKCVCGENKENMKHVYICKNWNIEITHTHYNLKFKDDIEQIAKLYERFRNNYETRKTYIDNRTVKGIKFTVEFMITGLA